MGNRCFLDELLTSWSLHKVDYLPRLLFGRIFQRKLCFCNSLAKSQCALHTFFARLWDFFFFYCLLMKYTVQHHNRNFADVFMCLQHTHMLTVRLRAQSGPTKQVTVWLMTELRQCLKAKEENILKMKQRHNIWSGIKPSNSDTAISFWLYLRALISVVTNWEIVLKKDFSIIYWKHWIYNNFLQVLWNSSSVVAR